MTAPRADSDTPLEDRDEVARGFLGRAVRVRREKCEMSLVDAAAALGISDRTLRRWEEGRGELWTGGPGKTVDQFLMAKLKAIYLVEYEKLHEGDPEMMAALRNQYPNAPLDPAARRMYFWRRNAKIMGIDPDEFVEMMQAQRRAVSNQRGEK